MQINTIVWLIQEKQWATEIAFDGGPVDTADTSYRSAIINKFKEWKKAMFKKLREDVIIMIYQVENINKEIKS